jgi:MYXO-CTERM domain-containing protein
MSEPERPIRTAFGPREIVGGFVLMAALIALLLRRRRGNRPPER